MLFYARDGHKKAKNSRGPAPSPPAATLLLGLRPKPHRSGLAIALPSLLGLR